MAQWFLHYELQDGYVHNWLVAGPQMIPVGEQDGAPALNRQQIAARYWQPDSEIEDPPSEQARFTVSVPEGAAAELSWRYVGCDDDHLLDLASSYPPRHYLRAWAYTEIISPAAQTPLRVQAPLRVPCASLSCGQAQGPQDWQAARLVLHAFGPAQVWLNGRPVLRQEGFSAQLPHGLACEVSLAKGANSLLVRLEQWVCAATPYAIALQILGVKHDKLKVRVPTLNQMTEKHQAVERLARRAYIEQDLYAGQECLHIKWPGSIRSVRKLMVRVQKPSGDIVGEAQPWVRAAWSQRLLEATWVKDGPYQIKVMPEFEDFIQGLRVSRDLDVNLLHSTHVAEPQGEQPASPVAWHRVPARVPACPGQSRVPARVKERATELLQHAAWWTEGLFSEIASMALGLWHQVNEAEILRAMDLALAGGEGCHKLMVGLLVMAYRYASDASFPPALAQRLEECLLGFDYEGDEATANDTKGMVEDVRQGDEDLAILRHVCNVLAGQRYPERLFVRSGQPGRWHQERGEQRAMEWLSRRAQGGFAAWDSSEGFESMLLGLVALVDHASSETLSEMAAAIADKLLFTLAINSFKGVFGSTHGSTSAASITDGRMEPTSGVSRLLWGVGCWNQHMAAGLTLAGSQKYECPPVLQFIALDRPEALWCRERHIASWSGSGDACPLCLSACACATSAGGTGQAGGQARVTVPGQEVNKVTYRTPDYMLCSAQDYRPGEAGLDEHIWQATMSPSAVVFVNHPGCMNQKKAYRPNFWCGNRVLPRVAQWRDLLIALYHLPDDDWLGYTHAHFPIAAFDEYALKRGWAFARKGDAYLALTASGGMTLIKSGPGAYRELRSVARQLASPVAWHRVPARVNVWLCQMGRAAQDGTFAEFQNKILALPVTFDGLGVFLVSLRGDTVTFGWTGPFTVKGTEQPLSGFRHYESPYCTCDLGAIEMDIQYGEWTLRLNLDASEE